MEPVPGFVFVPRLAGSTRPAGAFFSAAVESQAGPGRWNIRLDGRTVTVASDLELVPGQTLRLKLASQTGQRWLFQIVPRESPSTVAQEITPLMAAFLSRGLPLAADKLSAWTRKLAAGPSDKEGWAASLEARGSGPNDQLTQRVTPWLEWQAALEQGLVREPPDPEVWDDWNRHPAQGDPWLVVPLRWEYEGQADSGLLQAHWNPQLQAIDRWTVAAAPQATPFRLEALCRPERLELSWHFFREDDRKHWSSWLEQSGDLSHPGLRVSLRIAGAPEPERALRKGVDLEA